ncbi:hypothetical protein PA15_0312245 [Pseudomonas aeruginosa HB15]|nr:hypothetical protein PA15_0312245 [Pseudomonas aeruginosa HB15]KAJ12968.1 hypothetical protein M002_02195 [Pseudomonas aeruginosa ID4365]
MIVLQLLGRNCPEPAQHGAAQQSGGDSRLSRKCAERMQPLTARTP